MTAVVRPETDFPEIEGVEVMRGEVLAGGVIDRTLPGHDAVLSCLGLKRRQPWNPWSRLASPPDLASRTAGAIVAAMSREGIRRLVAISAAGVGDSKAVTHWLVRGLFASSNVGLSYRDLERLERVYAQSELDWLAVRPVTLVNGAPTGRARQIDRYGLTSRIARGDVAEWMLDAVERAEPFARHTEMIGKEKGVRSLLQRTEDTGMDIRSAKGT